MREAVIRDVEPGDVPEIRKLIDMTWDWPRMIRDRGARAAALGMYANQILNRSSFGKAVELDGRPAGVIFCSAKGAGPICRLMQDDGTAHALAALRAPDSERGDVCHALESVARAYEELTEGSDYDGEIAFLAVAVEAQGSGLGRRLWDVATEYFKARQARSMCLFTDTSCNFGFYEHVGCSRRREKEMKFTLGGQQLKLTSFLYDYKY